MAISRVLSDVWDTPHFVFIYSRSVITLCNKHALYVNVQSASQLIH